MSAISQRSSARFENSPHEAWNWRDVAYLVQLSRALDTLEETAFAPQRKIFYQFSARGHDMAQILLGLQLTRTDDAVCGYYRSRPILLALGVDPVDALGSSLARSGGYSDGRDIGAVFNYPNARGASALPMCGGVGAQFTPTVGWAQALDYRARVLNEKTCGDAIAVALGGDASVATNGFWSALTIATTLKLPMLFYIEDNGFGISVPSTLQTPGASISANLRGFHDLEIVAGDGTSPAEAAELIERSVRYVRGQRTPLLLHLKVPRLEGHSFQDTQTYKSEAFVKSEWARDPLPKLRDYLVPALFDAGEWDRIATTAAETVEKARIAAEARPTADLGRTVKNVFFEGELQEKGGQWNAGYVAPDASDTPSSEGARINMVTAIRRTLENELAINPRVVVFGEDVGAKGGVHAVTLGLQEKFGQARVFDTSLSEEGIIGQLGRFQVGGKHKRDFEWDSKRVSIVQREVIHVPVQRHNPAVE